MLHLAPSHSISPHLMTQKWAFLDFQCASTYIFISGFVVEVVLIEDF